jgi:hypothetical protein
MGETNLSLGILVCQLESYLTGGELSPAVEGRGVRVAVL